MTTESLPLERTMERRLNELTPSEVADTKHEGVQVVSHDIEAGHAHSDVSGVVRTVSLDPSALCAPVRALELAEEGEIIVVDAEDNDDEAIWGELLSTYAKTVGVTGVITNGAIRDVDGVRHLEFPAFSRTINPRGPSGDTERTQNEPVGVGGTTIHPGDVIVGNESGLVVIDRAVLGEVVEQAEDVKEAERDVERAIESGDTLEDAFERAGLE